MAMALTFRSAMLIVPNLLIPFAIWIFASGFFPYKPFLPGFAEYQLLPYESIPDAPFDKVVFMVVDALRSDFVYSNQSGFSYTQSLIYNGAAIPFTAYATAPTITMPRIKAITTGSIPSFLDMILSFAESDTSSRLSTQDTWLAQMKAKATGKTIMFGDDTWLKLFPETFDRADGTSSFFVSDFTEVDNNVTRHVPDELSKPDWTTMVLHYLGLDHIGHKAGPRSPNMLPKQQEMDAIVQQIYKAIEVQPHLSSTLLVLCGDHGMNDVGNHGGSSPGETSPALVFISPQFKTLGCEYEVPAPYREYFHYYESVSQLDIVPTLGALLGFPIPRNNLGLDQEQILVRNARQTLNILTATFPSFRTLGVLSDCHESSNNVEELACQWQRIAHGMSDGGSQVITQEDAVDIEGRQAPLNSDLQDWQYELKEWMSKAQDLMSSTASNYDMKKLVAGQAMVVVSLLLSIAAAYYTIRRSWRSTIPYLFLSVLYGCMMFASSYVEEEQQFWYWATSAWFMLIIIKSARRVSTCIRHPLLCILSLAIVRLIRRWNQSGQKFASEPDIARTVLPKHRLVLWFLVFTTYVWISIPLYTTSFAPWSRLTPGLVISTIVVCALSFKLAFTYEDSPELLVGVAKWMAVSQPSISLLWRARLVFYQLLAAATYSLIGHIRKPTPFRQSTLASLHATATILLLNQSRPTDIPLFLLCSLLLFILERLQLTTIEIITTTMLLRHTSFFALGNTNAISSIDLSSAYNGISSYNPLAVGLLTFIGNWAGPLFWSSGTIILLSSKRHESSPTHHPPLEAAPSDQGDGLESRDERWKQSIELQTIFTTSNILFTMLACTILRTHLFIWTVFSPKYLFVVAWSLGGHLLFGIGATAVGWLLQ